MDRAQKEMSTDQQLDEYANQCKRSVVHIRNMLDRELSPEAMRWALVMIANRLERTVNHVSGEYWAGSPEPPSWEPDRHLASMMLVQSLDEGAP